jgi:Protein of unknown function (DUF2934)
METPERNDARPATGFEDASKVSGSPPRFSIVDAAHLHQALAVYLRFPPGGSLVQSWGAPGWALAYQSGLAAWRTFSRSAGPHRLGSNEPRRFSMQAITFPNTKLTESMVEHETRVRAYEIYENRGKTEGHALEDWLQAEVDVQRRSCGVLKC